MAGGMEGPSHERLFDICNVAMTVTVIALTVLFFLSFQQPTAIAISTKALDRLNGHLITGSCGLGSISQTQIVRGNETSILLLAKIDATIHSRVNINMTKIRELPNESVPCSTYEVQRSAVPAGASAGKYIVTRRPDVTRPGEFCGQYRYDEDGRYFFSYFRGNNDVVENYLLEDTAPINETKLAGVTVFSVISQRVTGPSVSILDIISTTNPFAEILQVRLPEIEFNCQYRPGLQYNDPAFGLNVASIVVAILCLLVQLAYFEEKYLTRPGTKEQPSGKKVDEDTVGTPGA